MIISKFLSQGEVKVLEFDKVSRNAIIYIQSPLYVVQSSFPALLQAGMIQSISILDPIMFERSKISEEDLKPEFSSTRTVESVNLQMTAFMDEAAGIFIKLSKLLNSPAKVVPLLPVSIYISLSYVCQIDKFIRQIAEWEVEKEFPESDLKWAFTDIVAQILSQ